MCASRYALGEEKGEHQNQKGTEGQAPSARFCSLIGQENQNPIDVVPPPPPTLLVQRHLQTNLWTVSHEHHDRNLTCKWTLVSKEKKKKKTLLRFQQYRSSGTSLVLHHLWCQYQAIQKQKKEIQGWEPMMQCYEYTLNQQCNSQEHGTGFGNLWHMHIAAHRARNQSVSNYPHLSVSYGLWN